MIRRLVQSTDFERVLKTRSRASSPHFAVHHVASVPAGRARRETAVVAGWSGELSTGAKLADADIVDDTVQALVRDVWLGTVVPKRHARRAVTRNLLKRQIRNVVSDGAESLVGGLWVVRLRAPFDRGMFASAASDALRRQARIELQDMFVAALARQPRR